MKELGPAVEFSHSIITRNQTRCSKTGRVNRPPLPVTQALRQLVLMVPITTLWHPS